MSHDRSNERTSESHVGKDWVTDAIQADDRHAFESKQTDGGWKNSKKEKNTNGHLSH